MKPCLGLSAVAVGALIGENAALAGPPYLTDDPAPADTGRLDATLFMASEHGDAHEAQAGLDLGYGLVENLEISAILPVQYSDDHGGRAGLGDAAVGAKYRFACQRDGDWRPDISVAAEALLPTGSRHFTADRLTGLVALWAQKDMAQWSLFGGGGRAINPGAGQRDYWIGGFGLMRQLGDRLNLGAELYWQSPDAIDSRAFARFNLGATYKLAERWTLLASGGPRLHGRSETGTYAFYLGLQFSR